MAQNIKITKASPDPLGVSRINNGKDIRISIDYGKSRRCGILFRNSKTGARHEIILPACCRNGSVYSAVISGVDSSFDCYQLLTDSGNKPDTRSHGIKGLEKWGTDVRDLTLWSTIGDDTSDFDWGKDVRPVIPYEDMVVYLVHVRGYTMNGASGVHSLRRGTYLGLCDKISYLKSLGITTLELMPVCEINPVDRLSIGDRPVHGNMPEGVTAEEAEDRPGNIKLSINGSIRDGRERGRINFWGFKEGYFFAPRSGYASDKTDPGSELKFLVRSLHENGISIVLQFYFTDNTPDDLVISCLRHWVYEYHIDGIHFKGSHKAALAAWADPVLSDLMLWSIDMSGNVLYGASAARHNAALYGMVFMYCSRRFLRGDDNSIGDFVNSFLDRGTNTGLIKYVCDYEGFRLADLVSYEHKRNENNGEQNADGTDNNISWNCGVEGKTRRLDILSLRQRQMKNALTMLILAQGTPMLFGGDEFGNSQDGNNNPYCQDNPTGWIDWKKSGQTYGKELTEYVRFLIRFRNTHGILHEKSGYRLMDYMACGYPDLSFHGTEAWRPDMTGSSHAVGLLFCGLYDKGKDHDFIYIAFNMNWKKTVLALPKLPGQMRYHLISDTSENSLHPRGKLLNDQGSITCQPRSIVILAGKGKCQLGVKNDTK